MPGYHDPRITPTIASDSFENFLEGWSTHTVCGNSGVVVSHTIFTPDLYFHLRSHIRHASVFLPYALDSLSVSRFLPYMYLFPGELCSVHRPR